MTSRPAFGDFADAVRAQLHPGAGPAPLAAGRPPGIARARQVQEFTRSMAAW